MRRPSSNSTTRFSRTAPPDLGRIGDELDLTQPTVSRHLRTLREAALVTVRPDAQRRWYRHGPDGSPDEATGTASAAAGYHTCFDHLEALLDGREIGPLHQADPEALQAECRAVV